MRTPCQFAFSGIAIIVRMDLGPATMQALLTPKHSVLLLQPIYPLAGGTPYAHEAFLRLQHPDGTTLMPQDFIPAATNAGLLDKLDMLTLSQLRTQVLPTVNRFTGLLALNISPASLASRDYLHTLASPTWKNIVPSLLFELPARDFQSSLRVINYLRQAGVRFSVDLTPHDHLAPLLAVSAITSFKLRITQFTPKQLAETIALVRKHRHTATISHVENATQHRVAAEAQPDHVQGFHYATPQSKPSTALLQPPSAKSA